MAAVTETPAAAEVPETPVAVKGAEPVPEPVADETPAVNGNTENGHAEEEAAPTNGHSNGHAAEEETNGHAEKNGKEEEKAA